MPKLNSPDIYIVTQPNPFGIRPGELLVGEGYGEPLYRTTKRQIGKHRWHLVAHIFHLGLPFESLAPYIVRFGVKVPIEMLQRKPLPAQDQQVKEVQDFQRSVEDIVEPEAERRERAADPSPLEKGGIIVPTGLKKGLDTSEE